MGNPKKIKSKVKTEKEFIPPDGGWGWMIVIAAGFSNLCVLPTAQQFGLLFRDKFARLGITSSETTTVINMNSALTSCIGLANGPLFKIFSYRQVSLIGAIVVFVGLIGTTFSNNLVTYLITFSGLYGAGFGISSSANALALNTYWKDRRRLATGLSWTTTGLGPILWPIVITLLFNYFGETGAVLLLAGFSLHAVACALLLQPVKWHSKKSNTKEDGGEEKLLKSEIQNSDDKKKEGGYFTPLSKFKSLSVFSSQYLFNEDDPETPGYEIIDPGIPMMLRANDGYFSQSNQSKSGMSSKRPSVSNILENRSRKSSTLYLNESKKNSLANLGSLVQERETYKPKRNISRTDTKIPESEIEDCPSLKAPQDLRAEEKAAVQNIDPEKNKYKSVQVKTDSPIINNKSSNSLKLDTHYYGDKYNKDNSSYVSQRHLEDSEERKYLRDNHSNQSYRTRQRKKSNNFNYESEVLKQASMKLEQYVKQNEDNDQKLQLLISTDLENDVFPDKKVEEKEKENEKQLTFGQKVIQFFDLDLLKDFTFVNLMLGITLSNFNEINYSILTPFILGDYGKTKAEVAVYMSLLAGVDICVRFCIPFLAGKIRWENNSFFLFGVICMALGRVVLAHCQNYSVVLAVAVLIGFGKGFRTVFIALVIPSYVPLHKLPGASGIQLLTAGIVFLSLGPLVGWIKDNSSTAVTLHCLNIFTWLTALSWGMEKYIRTRQNKNSDDQA